VADDYPQVNVAVERDQPTSMLTLFRRLTELRRTLPALSIGTQDSVDAGSDDVFAFVRQHNDQRLLIILNFGTTAQRHDLTLAGTTATLLCSTQLDRDGQVDLAALDLRPDEGLLLHLDEAAA
jgi:alpha-glucosidase